MTQLRSLIAYCIEQRVGRVTTHDRDDDDIEIGILVDDDDIVLPYDDDDIVLTSHDIGAVGAFRMTR